VEHLELNLAQLRQNLHKSPELGFQETKTKATIAGLLHDFGLEVYEGTGVVGVLRSGSAKHAIGLRADMDALPILEKKHSWIRLGESRRNACLWS